MFEEVRATTEGGFRAVRYGQVLFVPDDFGSIERQRIAEWVSQGGTILPAPRPNLSLAVDAERDRRIRAPFVFQGVAYDADDVSQARIEKARLSALAAVAAGAQLGDVEWPGVGMPFAWIAADNVARPMDAQTTVAFGSVPVAREGLLIMQARAIKDRLLAGEEIEDVTVDELWSLPS